VVAQSLKVRTAVYTSAGRWMIERLSCLILPTLLSWVIKLTTWMEAAFIIYRAVIPFLSPFLATSSFGNIKRI
jgi:hypothetical protein